MSEGIPELQNLLGSALATTFMVAGPLLAIGFIVGLFVGILQAATQVHEPAVTFIPKLFATAAVLAATAPFLVGELGDLVKLAFATIGGGTP